MLTCMFTVLLLYGTSTASKEDSDLNKQDLEQEAIEFLISLNLSINDIYSLKVIGETPLFVVIVVCWQC